MRNYVILNGVNSLTKNGLAINEMPPISKPLMRTQKEEIDGRDGDIITELGYSAYDKELEIGLYGESYDINDIIAFFNNSGTVVFSDEPDKYYNYQIINQIDYEKLIKFKTATVVFHCQPFKYPLNEVPLEEEFEYVSGSGTNITLDNTAESTFNTFDLKGNTSQDGTPTPDAPVPVNVVSGDNEINVVCKNILPQNKYIATQTIKGIAYTNNGDGTFNLVGTATANTTIQIIPTGNITLKANQPYYLYSSVPYNVTTFNMAIAMSVEGAARFITANNTYTPTATPTNVRLQFYIGNGQSVNATNIKLMLVKGNTAPTEYEEYKGQSYEINLGSLELCKIGDYQDSIVKDNGKWYVNKQIGKVVLNGSESGWLERGNTSENYIKLRNSKALPYDSKGDLLLISDYFVTNIGANNASYSENAICGNSGNYAKWLHISIDNTIVNSVETFKTWLSTHNTEVYYVLATPQTIEITNEELINQLNALEQANSQSGQTNISQVNSDLPFLLDVVALKLDSDHLIINNIGNTYAKPTLDLEGTGIVDIYLNDIQMFQVDLSEVNEIVINTAEMEAYNPTTRALANRQVTGDYSNFKLAVGENDLRFSGNLTKATITNYQRWL